MLQGSRSKLASKHNPTRSFCWGEGDGMGGGWWRWRRRLASPFNPWCLSSSSSSSRANHRKKMSTLEQETMGEGDGNRKNPFCRPGRPIKEEEKLPNPVFSCATFIRCCIWRCLPAGRLQGFASPHSEGWSPPSWSLTPPPGRSPWAASRRRARPWPPHLMGWRS